MRVTGLFHVAIKTNDLAATERFYVELLGLKKVKRPDFGYPGAWLAVRGPAGEAIVHIYAGGPALGADTDAVLQELGYSTEDIAGLKSRGIL